MTIAIAAECHTTISTPIGRLLLLADDRGLRGVYVESQKYGPHWPRRRSEKHEVLERAACQLNEYFDGERTAFDLPLAPEGTEFQLRVWRALCQIDFVSTESYGGIARRIGRPAAR